MSIDISYLSFDQARADRQWSLFWQQPLPQLFAAHERKLELTRAIYKMQTALRNAGSSEAYLKAHGVVSPTDIELFNAEADMATDETWRPQGIEELQETLAALEQEREAIKIFAGLENAELPYFFHKQNHFGEEHTPDHSRQALLYALIDLDVKFGGDIASTADDLATGGSIFELINTHIPDDPMFHKRAELHEQALFKQCPELQAFIKAT